MASPAAAAPMMSDLFEFPRENDRALLAAIPSFVRTANAAATLLRSDVGLAAIKDLVTHYRKMLGSQESLPSVESVCAFLLPLLRPTAQTRVRFQPIVTFCPYGDPTDALGESCPSNASALTIREGKLILKPVIRLPLPFFEQWRALAQALEAEAEPADIDAELQALVARFTVPTLTTLLHEAAGHCLVPLIVGKLTGFIADDIGPASLAELKTPTNLKFDSAKSSSTTSTTPLNLKAPLTHTVSGPSVSSSSGSAQVKSEAVFTELPESGYLVMQSLLGFSTIQSLDLSKPATIRGLTVPCIPNVYVCVPFRASQGEPKTPGYVEFNHVHFLPHPGFPADDPYSTKHKALLTWMHDFSQMSQFVAATDSEQHCGAGASKSAARSPDRSRFVFVFCLLALLQPTSQR